MGRDERERGEESGEERERMMNEQMGTQAARKNSANSANETPAPIVTSPLLPKSKCDFCKGEQNLRAVRNTKNSELVHTICSNCIAMVGSEGQRKAELIKNPARNTEHRCRECDAPLSSINPDARSLEVQQQSAVGFCFIHQTMFDVTLKQPGLVRAQKEWENEQKKRKGILGK